MINDFFLVGEIKKVQVSTPKDPKKDPSAVLLVQYGDTRDTTDGPVQFVNAVMVRVPNYKYPQIKDKLKEGKTAKVHGHLQGVYKTVPGVDEGFLTVELVADRVFVEGEKGARASAQAAAESVE